MGEIKCRKCGKEFVPIKVVDFVGGTHIVDLCAECEKEEELEKIKK